MMDPFLLPPRLVAEVGEVVEDWWCYIVSAFSIVTHIGHVQHSN